MYVCMYVYICIYIYKTLQNSTLKLVVQLASFGGFRIPVRGSKQTLMRLTASMFNQVSCGLNLSQSWVAIDSY